MGMLKRGLVGVVAGRLLQEARKPQNQQRLREAVAKARSRRGSGTGTGR